jgi:hypothetical protein
LVPSCGGTAAGAALGLRRSEAGHGALVDGGYTIGRLVSAGNSAGIQDSRPGWWDEARLQCGHLRPADRGGCVHEGPDFAIGWRAFQPGEAFPAHIHEHFEEVFIATGTPWEAGTARTHPLCLVPGDLVEVEITGVGELSNTVVDEDDNESLSPA